MKRIKIESPELSSVGFDAATQTLEVELTSGTIFLYYNVTAVTHEALMKAPLSGTYYDKNIRNSGYKTRKVI